MPQQISQDLLSVRPTHGPGSTVEWNRVDNDLIIFGDKNQVSQGTEPKLHPELLWELLIRVRQFVSSYRHDLLLFFVVWCHVAVGADGCV